MKIALAQLNYRVGDFENNVSRITETIEKAKSQQAGLVVFAELCVCGYPPRDFLEFDDFIRRCDDAVAIIAGNCHGIAAIIGAPSSNPAAKGKPLYNTAFFLADGKILAKAHKTLLPNYDVFDEYRYFEPNRLPYSVVEYGGLRFAVTICEDLWNILPTIRSISATRWMSWLNTIPMSSSTSPHRPTITTSLKSGAAFLSAMH